MTPMRIFVLFACIASLGACTVFSPSAEARTADLKAVSDQLMAQGRAAFGRGDTDKAIALLEQAVTANPKNAAAFGLLGRVYLKAGQPDLADKYYEIALSINPDDRKILQWSGERALARNDTDVAREKLKRLQWLCKSSCAEYRALKVAVDKAPAPPPKPKAKK